jgi:competence ComEA-like helix-hairpin-helix protein
MKNLFEKLSDLLYVTKSEIRLTLSIFLILFVGFILSKLDITNEKYDINKLQYNQLIDSLVKRQYTLDSKPNAEKQVATDSSSFVQTPQNFEKAIGIVSDNTEKNIGVTKSHSKKEFPTYLVDIQNATIVDLMKLPGIGEKTAQVIIEYRRSNPFKNIKDIQNVKGIGPKKFEKMKPYITVTLKK